LLVDNEDWPLAKYRELLFIRWFSDQPCK
jgi:hypothetical protein